MEKIDLFRQAFHCPDCYDTGFIPDSYSLENMEGQKCTNKIHNMGKGENKKRRILREEFINNHIILCKEVFTGENRKEANKSPEGRILVELARIELHYSPKTVSVDIYSRLINTFNEM